MGLACCLACRKADLRGGGELQGSKSAKCLEKASLSLYCGCGYLLAFIGREAVSGADPDRSLDIP